MGSVGNAKAALDAGALEAGAFVGATLLADEGAGALDAAAELLEAGGLVGSAVGVAHATTRIKIATSARTVVHLVSFTISSSPLISNDIVEMSHNLVSRVCLASPPQRAGVRLELDRFNFLQAGENIFAPGREHIEHENVLVQTFN